jgi:HlyD family secretion protein
MKEQSRSATRTYPDPRVLQARWISASILSFAMLALMFSAGCSKGKQEEPTVAVQVAPVAKKTIEREVSAEAILFPLQQSAIVPKISAPVKKFYVMRGRPVRQGQLLAVLENRDLSAAQQDTKGAYEQAQAAYETTTAASLPEDIQKAKGDAQVTKENLDATQKVYDSRQDLYKQGALPRKDLDQAAVNLVQARNQYDVAQKHLDSLLAVGKQQTIKSATGQLESAKGKYMGAAAQLSYSEIRSPINGVVTDRPLYPGEMASAGTPLITVMDLSQVIARAHIPQDQAALLKLGDKATITVPEQEKPLEGKVTVVSPALDPNSTTVEIWVQAKNPGNRAKPGSSVRVEMLSQTVPNALVVPASAVLTGADGATSVMVVGPDSHAHAKEIKLGIKQGDQQQILQGVNEGDKVITSGAYGLPDNTKVTVEAPKAAPEQDKPAAGAKKEGDSDEK